MTISTTTKLIWHSLLLWISHIFVYGFGRFMVFAELRCRYTLSPHSIILWRPADKIDLSAYMYINTATTLVVQVKRILSHYATYPLTLRPSISIELVDCSSIGGLLLSLPPLRESLLRIADKDAETTTRLATTATTISFVTIGFMPAQYMIPELLAGPASSSANVVRVRLSLISQVVEKLGYALVSL